MAQCACMHCAFPLQVDEKREAAAKQLAAARARLSTAIDRLSTNSDNFGTAAAEAPPFEPLPRRWALAAVYPLLRLEADFVELSGIGSREEQVGWG